MIHRYVILLCALLLATGLQAQKNIKTNAKTLPQKPIIENKNNILSKKNTKLTSTKATTLLIDSSKTKASKDTLAKKNITPKSKLAKDTKTKPSDTIITKPAPAPKPKFYNNPPSAFLRYAVNGKEHGFTNEDIITYIKPEENENIQYTAYSIFIKNLQGEQSKKTPKLNIIINTPKNQSLHLGKIPFKSVLGYRDSVQYCFASIEIKSDNMDYKFYEILQDNQGSFEITKIKGNEIEAKFEMDLPLNYEEGTPLKITKGKFKAVFKKM